MPYYLKRAAAKKDLVIDLNYEPEMDLRLKALIAMGKPMTDAEIGQISSTLRLIDEPSIGLPDVIGWGDGPYVVSPQLSEKIEELEPGVHRLVPLQLFGKKNKTYGTYYLLLLTQSLDAVVLDGTRFRLGFGPEAAEKSGFALDHDGPCVLDQSVIEGRHLWRGAGRGDPWSDYFCSDALGEFMKERKMRGWDMLPCEVEGIALKVR